MNTAGLQIQRSRDIKIVDDKAKIRFPSGKLSWRDFEKWMKDELVVHVKQISPEVHINKMMPCCLEWARTLYFLKKIFSAYN